MKHFRKLFKSSGCFFCPRLVGIIKKINKKMPSNKKYDLLNVKDTEDYGITFWKILKKIESFDGTPHISIGKISGGKIEESFNILGGYNEENLMALKNGFHHIDFNEDVKDDFETQLKEKTMELENG